MVEIELFVQFSPHFANAFSVRRHFVKHKQKTSMQLNWKKNISNNFTIYDNKNQIGSLNNEIFSEKVTGQIELEKYLFRKRNIFENETLIFEKTNNKEVGKIKYSIWNNKAEIIIGNEKLIWKYKNSLNSEWSIQDNGGENINFKSNFFDGTISGKSQKIDVQILIGLYIYKHYQRNAFAVLFILFLPPLLKLILK